jgi:nucleotide-binding universal stress UspA family protein
LQPFGASPCRIPRIALRKIPQRRPRIDASRAVVREKAAACRLPSRDAEALAMITLRHILVATDFSEPSDTALAYGRELASRFNATLHVLHVVQNPYLASLGIESAAVVGPQLTQQLEDDARQRLEALTMDSDHSGPRTRTVVRTGGSPALEVVEYAKAHDVELIVMGTHGRGALAHIVMGSVAERVVRIAHCPVLTVRHPERDFVQADVPVAVARI